MQRDNLWKGFRMTPYAAPRVTFWLGAVPLSVGVLATVLDVSTLQSNPRFTIILTSAKGKMDWAGKRKGESLWREPATSTK